MSQTIIPETSHEAADSSTIDFRTDGAAILHELVTLRRELHADPEIGTNLPRTQQRLLNALEGLPLEITLGERLTSIVAVLRGELPGPTVLLRGDMDGLPVTEKTGLPYRSENGAMHACGHDLHMAGLVGAARLLSAHRSQIPGNVIFMFQPGEEVLLGAKMMIDEGLLTAAGDIPVAAYGLHVAPGPFGHFALSAGTATAGSTRISITIHGKGGHGSRPHEAVDPVPILAETILALQSLVTRQLDAQDPVVLTLTVLEAGTTGNVIPDTATAKGTLRNLSDQALTKAKDKIARLVPAIAEAHGASAQIEMTEGCPVLVNSTELTDQSESVLSTAFGASRVTRKDTTSVMGSEDFSFVAQKVPASFFRLLVSPADLDPSETSYNHSPLVRFDDAILGDQAAALAGLALNRLQQG
mgnify:CR=1 FL=1